jgi:hypothetical protein
LFLHFFNQHVNTGLRGGHVPNESDHNLFPVTGFCKRCVCVASGMETRCPERPGQRQQCWLCAEHDSPPGRPVQPDKFAVLSKKQCPAVQQGNRKQTNDSNQQQNLPDRRNVKVRKRKEGRCMREGEKRCEAPPSRPERTISPEGVHASDCGRSGKKGCQGKLTAPYKGARGMPGHISPEKAGFPPPPGCYLPDS